MSYTVFPQLAVLLSRADDPKELGASIRSARKSLGLTAPQFAQMLELHPKTILKLERGAPGVVMCTRVAAVFLVTSMQMVHAEQVIEAARWPAH